MRRIQPLAIVEGEKTGCDVNFLSLQIHALFLNNALDLLRSQDRCTGIEISTLQLLAQSLEYDGLALGTVFPNLN